MRLWFVIILYTLIALTHAHAYTVESVQAAAAETLQKWHKRTHAPRKVGTWAPGVLSRTGSRFSGSSAVIFVYAFTPGTTMAIDGYSRRARLHYYYLFYSYKVQRNYRELACFKQRDSFIIRQQSRCVLIDYRFYMLSSRFICIGVVRESNL